MAKYKLTVKYDGVCDLSIAGDIPNIIANEFDQYVKSMLYKKEEWENFEANFKVAAKQEYTNQKNEVKLAASDDAKSDGAKENKPDDVQKTSCADDAPVLIEEENIETEPTTENASENIPENAPAEEISADEEDIQDGFPIINDIAPLEETKKEVTIKENGENTAEDGPTIKVEITNEKILPFEKFIKDKKINSALDEFVAGACYLDEILNIKEFTLKEINAKLFPAFGRLASSAVIKQAAERVLIETIKKSGVTKYKINENAWNYHNYDLVGQ